MKQLIQLREAGRPLDMEIAEKIMGWEWRLSALGNRCLVGPGYFALFSDRATGDEPIRVLTIDLPHYSTDIAAAFQVVDALRAKGWTVSIDDERSVVSEWCVVFSKSDPWHADASHQANAYAKELPLAICMAALAAVREEGQ